MDMTGQFNQVPSLPENWSGSAMGMGALAVWPAGVATTSLVCCVELFLLGGRRAKVLWSSHSTCFCLGFL